MPLMKTMTISDKNIIITLCLLTAGVVWIFFVSLYVFELACNNQSYSIFQMLWTFPGIGLMMFSLIFAKRMTKNA